MSDRIEEAHTGANDQGEISELKMITFSLAGKDYGIDIMQVKEISRMLDFTYIPNSPYYVRGVYNLRGEIISVIDLRLLFHLPIPEKEEAASDEDVENLIVLQFGDYYLGVVVDRVDKVCAVRMSDVQPAHPLFSDISIKYINGLAHLNDRLYILLNIELLADSDLMEEHTAEHGPSPFPLPSASTSSGNHSAAENQDAEDVKPVSVSEEKSASVSTAPEQSAKDTVDTEILFKQFSADLASVCGFHINSWNRKSVYESFIRFYEEKGDYPVFHTAVEFSQLYPFLNPPEESLWPAEYFDAVRSLSFQTSDIINVWCSWCGYGYDAYSAAAALLSINEDMRLRVWATDDDLLKISMGPNLTVSNIDPSHPIFDFAEETKNGFKFKKILAEKLLFEYHSIENGNPFPKMKFIIAKGRTSFYNTDTAEKIIAELYAKLDSGSYIMVADYENLPETDFKPVYTGSMKIYQRI